MKSHFGKLALVLFLFTVFSFGTILAPVNARAQAEGKALIKQIEGTWILVAAVNERDGNKTNTFGLDPQGQMILTADGRFSVVMVRANIPKFVSNNRVKGTAGENQTVVQGSFASFGSYKVANEEDKMIIMHIEGCTFPNWSGQDQKRIMAVSGNELKQTVPASAVGGVTYNVWKRAEK
jgi:hypothetical protein